MQVVLGDPQRCNCASSKGGDQLCVHIVRLPRHTYIHSPGRVYTLLAARCPLSIDCAIAHPTILRPAARWQMFVMHRILRVPLENPMLWQLALTDQVFHLYIYSIHIICVCTPTPQYNIRMHALASLALTD